LPQLELNAILYCDHGLTPATAGCFWTACEKMLFQQPALDIWIAERNLPLDIRFFVG
jgi:hypothetical protein